MFKKILLALSLAVFATGLLQVVGAPEPAHAYAHEGYRWKYGKVCVIDHTGSQWPVYSATYRWSRVPDLSWKYGSDCNDEYKRQKVHVYAGYYGRTGWHAWTTCYLYSKSGNWEWLGNGYRAYRCTVKLNNTYRPSGWGDRRSVIMHEFGHGSGLEHFGGTTNALMNVNEWRYFDTPTYDDKRGVEARYPW